MPRMLIFPVNTVGNCHSVLKTYIFFIDSASHGRYFQPFLVIFFVFYTMYQAGFKVMIPLPQSVKCWDYKHVLPCSVTWSDFILFIWELTQDILTYSGHGQVLYLWDTASAFFIYIILSQNLRKSSRPA